MLLSAGLARARISRIFPYILHPVDARELWEQKDGGGDQRRTGAKELSRAWIETRRAIIYHSHWRSYLQQQHAAKYN